MLILYDTVLIHFHHLRRSWYGDTIGPCIYTCAWLVAQYLYRLHFFHIIVHPFAYFDKLCIITFKDKTTEHLRSSTKSHHGDEVIGVHIDDLGVTIFIDDLKYSRGRSIVRYQEKRLHDKVADLITIVVVISIIVDIYAPNGFLRFLLFGEFAFDFGAIFNLFLNSSLEHCGSNIYNFTYSLAILIPYILIINISN